MVFRFQRGVSGQISALMLEPSFLSKVADLTYSDPEFEWLLLRLRGSDAMFSIMTIHCVDLLYCILGTGR